MVSCLICASQTSVVSFGSVAPWIVDLAEHDIDGTMLLRCDTCTFTFFSHRFSDDEMAALYSEYRNESYYKVRHSWEPWYRPAVNDAYMGNSTALDERVQFMSEILKSAGRSDLGVVVDVGGDEGQFFPDISCERRIVVDVSNKVLRPGVERAETLDDVQSKIELLIAAHILEHVNEPVEFVRNLASHLVPGGLLYLEVPLDAPKISSHHSTENYRSYLKNLQNKNKQYRILIDFITGVARQIGFQIPNFGFIKQSEHINYFSEKSLTTLVSNLGFEVVSIKLLPDAKVGGLRLGRMGLLAQKF